MFQLSEMFGQWGGPDAFGQRAVKNIRIRTDIGQTFAETGTTNGFMDLAGPWAGLDITLLNSMGSVECL